MGDSSKQRNKRNSGSNRSRKVIRDIKKRKRKRTTKKILILLLMVLLFCVGYGSVYIYNILNEADQVSISKTNEDLGISDTAIDKVEDIHGIINIALFGLDSRSEDDKGRSDSIMVLTVDATHQKLKLSSIMRDSYVSIDGHGKDKINHAYAYGGPQLAIKTLNQNFDLNIKDFMTVDFAGMEDIIDAMGGVTINVKEEEVEFLNADVDEQARLRETTPTHVEESGVQLLNGMQAVGYARIRSTAGGDFERTDRQRTVLEAIFQKVKSAGITEYPSIAKGLLSYVTTSLSSSDILKLGVNVLRLDISTIEQARFPLDDYSYGGLIKKVWYLQYDEEATKEQIYNFIFEDISPYEDTSNENSSSNNN